MNHRHWRRQRRCLSTPPATESEQHPLELYSQLKDDEFLYVQELKRVYDESSCFFVQWVICKETKELVNSARISAIQQGKKFTWVYTRLEILKSLTADAHGPIHHPVKF
jgi:hypothetical protein